MNLEHNALKVLDKNKERLTIKDITYNKDVGKIICCRSRNDEQSGVASRMFEALYNSRSQYQHISTSEIRITVLVAEKDIDKDMNAKYMMNLSWKNNRWDLFPICYSSLIINLQESR